jgi:hypothetical protein
MKIVLLVSAIESGGLSKVVLAQNYLLLNDIRYDVKILTLRKQKKYCFANNIRRLTIYELFFEKYDLVISHGLPADLVSFLFKIRRQRTLNWIHGYYPYHFKWENFNWILRILFRYSSLFVLKFGKAVFLDEEMENFYLKLGYKGLVVPNYYQSICKGIHQLLDETIPEHIIEFKLKFQTVLIAICGTSRRKGYDRVINFAKRWPSVGIVIVGEIDEKETVALNNIFLQGYFENWKSLLNIANGLLHLSRAEGSPLGVIEALESCKPIFLSNILAHKNLMGYSGVFSVSSFDLLLCKKAYIRDVKHVDFLFLETIFKICEKIR